MHAKYAFKKENKNLQYQNVVIRYVLLAFSNYINRKIIKIVQYVEKQIGINKLNENHQMSSYIVFGFIFWFR